MADYPEPIYPTGLTLPSIPVAKQAETAPTGYIGMSGASLVFFDGTAWRQLTGDNTGD